MTEKQWQALVLELAEYCGWGLRYHTYDSRRSAAGFPDLVLIRGWQQAATAELIVVELKTDKGRVSPAQQTWLDAFAASGVETHVWRPRDLEDVRVRLNRMREEEGMGTERAWCHI